MNKLRPLLFAALVFTLFSCEKEYSLENSQNVGSNLIIGIDCRISKIVYTDTSGTAAGGTGTGLGSIESKINSQNIDTLITRFDSLSNTIEFIVTPVYVNDTIYINPDEYFVVDINKRIIKLHGLLDPTDPFSPQFDVFYQYNATGYLVAKNYFFTLAPTILFYQINYTYSGGNLIRMTGTDQSTRDLVVDADVNYFSNIIPKRYLYIFPDENAYPYFNQFYNYGVRNYNAIKKMTVRNYDPGNVVRDSLVSTFSNYIMSRDTYVLSVQMAGDDQQSIPALAGKLTFSYKCR